MPPDFRSAGRAAKDGRSRPAARAKLDDITSTLPRQATIEEMGTRNANWFDIEIEKLEHWAEDRRATLKAELDELDEALKLARKNAPHRAHSARET